MVIVIPRYFYDCTPLKLDEELRHHGQPFVVNLNVRAVILEVGVCFFFYRWRLVYRVSFVLGIFLGRHFHIIHFVCHKVLVVVD